MYLKAMPPNNTKKTCNSGFGFSLSHRAVISARCGITFNSTNFSAAVVTRFTRRLYYGNHSARPRKPSTNSVFDLGRYFLREKYSFAAAIDRAIDFTQSQDSMVGLELDVDCNEHVFACNLDSLLFYSIKNILTAQTFSPPPSSLG